ncbi:ABC transporter permease subunit [Arthrobacter sp. MA-N2]|uniref:ABC transporter permease subunit n=1 Tax=Arthrobacter sp. MA-N2 TaxID=1101188 RepID=UPI000487DE0C|nr:ATP-binding cassette domain-containing protein [Arthrobacter sp. MA-N2]
MQLGILLSGVVTGSLYALTSVAVVIIYKSSKIANFALGGTASLSVYAAYAASGQHLPWVVLLLIGMLAGAAAGALTELVIRLLGEADHLSYVVATFALFLITQGLIVWIWGPDNKPFPTAWSTESGWRLDGVLISYNNILAVVVALVVVLALQLVVQRTRFGLAIRMASSGPMTARLLGLAVKRVRFWTWVLGGGIGGLAAILVTPSTTLSPSGFTSFMMVALVALVIGGFTNIRGAATGGFILGVLLNVLGFVFTPSLTQTYLFGIVAVLLFVKPNGVLGVRDATISEPVIHSTRFRRIRSDVRENAASINAYGQNSRNAVPRRVRRSAAAVAIVVLIIVLPLLVPTTLLVLLPQLTAIYISVLGLNILVGYSGQLSVGQSAIMAIGAYAGAIAVAHLGVPTLVAIPIGLITGLIAGLIIGLPAVRLGPLFLTLFTLVLSFAVPEMITYFDGITGGTQGLELALPASLFYPTNQYWLGAGIALACTVSIYLARRSEFGRRWIAVRDSTAGSQATGLNPGAVKLGAFVVASGLAGLGGVLNASFTGLVTPTDYSPFLSITLLVAVVVGGTGSIPGALIGAALLTVTTAYAPEISLPPDLILGLVLLVVLVLSPAGAVDIFRRAGSRAAAIFASRSASTTPLPRDEPKVRVFAGHHTPSEREVTGPRPLLEIIDLSAGYAEAKALSGVSIALPEGSVTALLGSNGAGKTTLLRVISGLVRPSQGEARYAGTDISITAPSALAQAGIAHVPEGRGIFPDLSVKENLSAARFSGKHQGAVDISQALDVFPALRPLLSQRAGSLSGGQQQMLAVGRAMLTKPRLLLLDEPTLGLSPLAAKNLLSSLDAIRGTGLTVLLVEQNARAALGFADRAYVMSGGRVVAEGPSAHLLDEDILASYMGVKA